MLGLKLQLLFVKGLLYKLNGIEYIYKLFVITSPFGTNI